MLIMGYNALNAQENLKKETETNNKALTNGANESRGQPRGSSGYGAKNAEDHSEILGSC
jgi:hypothetical protein